jgi:hypothetical protein
MWVMLTPRETELVSRATSGQGQNAEVLEAVKYLLDPISGEIEIPDDLAERIRGAARNWAGGYEDRLKVLVKAMELFR